MNFETSAQLVLLLVGTYYLIYKICKLPKKVRNVALVILALAYSATIIIAVYYPEPLLALVERF